MSGAGPKAAARRHPWDVRITHYKRTFLRQCHKERWSALARVYPSGQNGPAGLVEGGAVLDVGCGTGSLTFEIAARRIAASIDALDYEFGFVEAVNTRKGAASINVRQGDAIALPYESA